MKLTNILPQSVKDWHYTTFRAPKRYHHLFDSIKEVQAKNILEVGVWNGKRAIKMIETAKLVSSSEMITYYGFDLFENLDQAHYEKEVSKKPPAKQDVENLLSTTGVQIKLFSGNTLVTMPQVIPTLPTMDFVFIDGGHSLETIAGDWSCVQKLMHSNTIVIFDDYWRNRSDAGAKMIVDSIDREKYTVQILKEIDSFDNADFGRLDISFAKVTRK